MLNNFTYQLELNELNKTNTKQKLKDKISKYNQKAFKVTAGCEINIYLPWYSAEMHAEEVLSKILNFKLLQLAIDKYASTYSIDELPIYARKLFKINFTIQPKENTNE